MKKVMLITLVIFAAASFAMAQIGASPATDVLGAHLNYGRGCAACHAPHSGAYGNGAAKTADPTSGNVALWGQDVARWSAKPSPSAGRVRALVTRRPCLDLPLPRLTSTSPCA